MDDVSIGTILGSIARHGLTTIGGSLVTAGYLDKGSTQAFVGGGMVLVGVLWSWWQKKGQAEVISALQSLRRR